MNQDTNFFLTFPILNFVKRGIVSSRLFDALLDEIMAMVVAQTAQVWLQAKHFWIAVIFRNPRIWIKNHQE